MTVSGPRRLAVDGTIVQGDALVTQQTLTGEALAVERAAGDPVFASTVVEHGKISVRVERVGLDTTVGRIVQAVESAAEEKSQIQLIAANTAIGYATESRVERVLAALQALTTPKARVLRDGAETIIDAATLVPGDVIVLEAGHDVAADARIIESEGLAVDESALTGESVLERQLDAMGRRLVGVSLGACGAAFALGVLRGSPPLAMLASAISLAVAAVPEGLPAVATTTLALGGRRMMQRGMLVRRLSAVESLGTTTVICADKTGTLTENRMTVDSWYVGRRTYSNGTMAGAAALPLRRALEMSVLCNEPDLGDDATPVRGSSTEAALLAAARDAGVDHRARRQSHALVDLRRRSNGQHWMATTHANGGPRHVVSVKGAPEQVLALCDRWLDQDGVRPLDGEAAFDIVAANATMAARGLRVLGLAFKETDGSEAQPYEGLTWVGLVGLTDPVRPGVREASAACRRAGIRTVILTGDQAQTAAAVCRDLELVPDGDLRVVEASALAELDERDLRRLIREVDVFARVSPVDKYQVARALQSVGEIVAMTGDGINDAAALRAADIGIAMGAGGTEVARDVADVVLLDDNFGTIVRAIEYGRTVHTNIGKSVQFLLATNASEILLTVGGLAVGVARPMTAPQFLWINLLSDVGPALALAVEPAEADVMARPPKDPTEPMLSRSALTAIGQDAAVLSAVTLAAQGLAFAGSGSGPRASTIAFSTLTTAQLLHALSYRSTPAPTRLLGG